MNRPRLLIAATAAAQLALAALALAQTPQSTPSTPPPQAPPMSPVLAGKKFTPPVKGEALVEFMQPVTKKIPAKNIVETQIKLRNKSAQPIARLTVTETWYDKGGQTVATGRGVINGLLQPDEVQTITIDTPYNDKMSSNNWNFTHANGTVKPAKVKSLDAAPAAAAPAKK